MEREHQEAAREPQHGPVEPVLRHPERADAEPDQDDADVLDAVVREEALEIVLREREDDAENTGQIPRATSARPSHVGYAGSIERTRTRP